MEPTPHPHLSTEPHGSNGQLESLAPLERLVSAQVFVDCTREISYRGQHWTVYERETVDGRRSLIFAGDRIARRVLSYPARWHTLSEAELGALAESR